MANQEELVSLEDAKEQVKKVCARLALLHLSFSRTLVEEFGEQKGKELILKAIKHYGIMVGNKAKEKANDARLNNSPNNYKGDLPDYGMHDRVESTGSGEEKRTKAYGCVMGEVWKELGEDKLGRLYCYVDPAKYMAFNPYFKLVHIKAITDGDDYCEFVVRPTTKKEREDFSDNDRDWSYIDK
jgi:hypothetical protein